MIHQECDVAVELRKTHAKQQNAIDMGTKASKQQVYAVPSRVLDSNRFEELSNELIYEVFDYLSFYHVSRAFGRLNQRLESLINTHSHYLNLQQHTCADASTFPRQIHSLKINARYQFSFIDFGHLRFVRDLLVSNLPAASLLHIFNTVSLHHLRYVYLGACSSDYEFAANHLREVQEKVLALGQSSLKRCVIRTQLLVDVDGLPKDLPSLEYLRIGGCDNISLVYRLLERMPRLKSLQVSILKPTPPGEDKSNSSTGRHGCLTNLTLRMHAWRATDELMPLLTRYGSNVRNLTIYFEPPITFQNFGRVTNSSYLKGLRQWITTSVQPLLPHLANFHLRQHVLYRHDKDANGVSFQPPYHEDILCPLEGKSYGVTVAAHLKPMWDSTL